MAEQRKECEKRDRILNRLARTRSRLVSQAYKIALQLARQNGRVSAPEVLRIMRKRKYRGLKNIDPRFMGVVFRTGWERIGLAWHGSHGQAVTVWQREADNDKKISEKTKGKVIKFGEREGS
jgi:hypothetical protein